MKDKKTSANRLKKQQIVAELSQKAEKAKNLIFADYQGLTHVQLEALKKKLKTAKAEFVVTKNTLLKLSLKGTKLPEEDFHGATAAIYLYDEPIAVLRELAKSIKELKLPNLKFGIVEGEALNGEQLLKLSTLPPKEFLLAQVISGLKSPLFGLVYALNWNITKLVLTLKSIEQNKQKN